MDYAEFKDALVEGIRRIAETNVEIEIIEARKNNGVVLDAVLFKVAETGVSPQIYIEPYYEKFKAGKVMKSIIEDIYEFYLEKRDEAYPKQAVEDFADFGRIKGRIVFKLVNHNMNNEALDDMPHRDYLDLAVTYCVLLDTDANGQMASIQISNSHMDSWGVTVSDLHAAATENSPRLLKSRMEDMGTLLARMLPTAGPMMETADINDCQHSDEPGSTMFVLTNSSNVNGAACILYPGLLESISEKWDSDFYVLPSSIHEMILLPESPWIEKDALDSLVRSVNESTVGAQEVLSDHAYLYSRREGRLVAA